MLLPFRPKRKRDPSSSGEKYQSPIVQEATFDVIGGMYTELLPSKLEEKYIFGSKNVYIREGKLFSRFGYTTFGGNLPLDSAIMGIFHVYAYDLTDYLLAFTTDHAFKYNSGTGDWDDITDSAADYSGGVDDSFSLDVIYDDNGSELLYVSTNRTDAVKKWNGANDWDDLGGSPQKCTFLKNFQHFLMLFDCTIGGNRFPQTIYWSDRGLPETWTGGASGSVNLARSSDFIIGAEILRNQLAIYKEDSIAMCYYNGSGSNPFTFEEKKIEGTGCKARDTIRSIGDRHLFLGQDNVYLFDGFSTIPVSNKIRHKLIDSIDPSKFKKCHAHLMEEFGLYLLCVPKVGSTYPDAIWCYNYPKEAWTYWECADEFISSGYYLSSGALTIAQLTGMIKTLNFKLGSRSIGGTFPTSLFGDENGYIYEFKEVEMSDNGTAIETEIISKGYILDEVGKFTRHSSIGVYGKGSELEIHLSKDDGVTFTKQGNITLNKSGVELGFCRSVEAVAERVMYKIVTTTLNAFFEIEGWFLSGIKKGKKVVSTYLNFVYDVNGSQVVTTDATGNTQPVLIRK